PVPRALPVAGLASGVPAPHRRHYLRATADPHPGLDRRIESLVRRAGLSVQNRASRSEESRIHLAYMVSACAGQTMADVCEAVGRLARVSHCLCLGVLE
ncbi:MAG: hypothetical protein ACT4QD_07015, partial [Acidobacteriota bacterium]